MRTTTVTLNRAADDLNNKHLTLTVERAGRSYWWTVSVNEDGYPNQEVGSGVDDLNRMKSEVAGLADLMGFGRAHRAALTRTMLAA